MPLCLEIPLFPFFPKEGEVNVGLVGMRPLRTGHEDCWRFGCWNKVLKPLLSNCRITTETPSSCPISWEGGCSYGSIPRPTHRAERLRVAGSAIITRNSTTKTCRSWGSVSTPSRRIGRLPRNSISPIRCFATPRVRLGSRTEPAATGTRSMRNGSVTSLDPMEESPEPTERSIHRSIPRRS